MRALALSSLLLGLAGFLGVCVFGISSKLGAASVATGLFAAVLGATTLARIRKSMETGGAMTIAAAGICAGSIVPIVIIVFIFIVIALAAFSHPDTAEPRRRMSCSSNLKQIGLAMKQYAMDYGGRFPDREGAEGLEKLRAGNYLTDMKIFICPSSRLIPDDPDKPLTEEHVSYRYFSGLDEKSPEAAPLVWDKAGSHSGFCNILRRDGHVEGFTGKDWLSQRAGAGKPPADPAGGCAESRRPSFFPNCGK